jgi:hypothetical protein
MTTDPRVCMFCEDALPRRTDEPVNIAFLSHIEDRSDCDDAFQAWKGHIQTDFIGA